MSPLDDLVLMPGSDLTGSGLYMLMLMVFRDGRKKPRKRGSCRLRRIRGRSSAEALAILVRE